MAKAKKKKKVKEGPYLQTPRAKKRPGKTVAPGGIQVIKPVKKGQKPIAFKKGALTKQAARYGMTPKEFCQSKKGDSPLKRKRCTLAFKGALAAGRKTLAAKKKKK